MTRFEPRVNFAELSDTDIANIGLHAAQVAFEHDVKEGLTNGDSLILVVGTVDDGKWNELGIRGFGTDANEFLVNVDPNTGKLATALEYEVDSGDAYADFGRWIPEGPRRYTGGVYFVAHADTVERGRLTRIFAGAGSGVQGVLDEAEVYSALKRMAAAWTLREQALYGKP